MKFIIRHFLNSDWIQPAKGGLPSDGGIETSRPVVGVECLHQLSCCNNIDKHFAGCISELLYTKVISFTRGLQTYYRDIIQSDNNR